MAPKPEFIVGERILCFSDPLIYNAKCLEAVVTKDGEIKYFIHYAGWKNKWNEWVPESRVLKYNKTNLAKQKKLQESYINKTPKKLKRTKRRSDSLQDSDLSSRTSVNETPRASKKQKLIRGASASDHESSSDAAIEKRIRLHPNVKIQQKYFHKIEMKVKLPLELKLWLVADWNILTRQRKLPKLPARTTVDRILDSYLTSKRTAENHNSSHESAAIEITNGIKKYFNILLGTQLLYNFEMRQYGDILHQYSGMSMSQIYGTIHLLRFFVRLDGMMAYTHLDERGVQLLLTNIHDFVTHIGNNSSSFLSLEDYSNASTNPLRKTM